MKEEDISLAGFVLTPEEWQALDLFSRAELMGDDDIDSGWQAPAEPPRRAQRIIDGPAWEPAEDPWAFADEPWSLAAGSREFPVTNPQRDRSRRVMDRLESLSALASLVRRS
jgi:hypothetical protein